MNAKNSFVRLLQQSFANVNMCASAVALTGATCLCGSIQGAETETSRVPQTYFVAPAGSDDNAGTTQAKPWQTISKVNKAALQPGDSVLLEGGKSFAGNLLITASGNKNAFITISSYGTGPATIQAGDSFGIRLLNCQYIKVHDLILEGSGVKPDGTSTNKEPGLDIFSNAKEGRPWQSIYVEKIAVSGFHDGIFLHTPIGTQDVVGYDDVRIINCSVKECLFWGFGCYGSKRTTGKPFNCAAGAGVFTNCYLGDCTFHDIIGTMITGDKYCGGASPVGISNATSFLMERCTISNCGQALQSKGLPGGIGGMVFLECEKCVAQFNECYGIETKMPKDGCAFDIDGGCSNCILQYNYSHDNEGSGFQTGCMPGGGPVRDNIIRYNISQNDAKKNPDKSGGISTWGTHGSTYVYNNTVFISAGIDGKKPAAFLATGEGLTVFNNIFVVAHDGDIVCSKGGNIFRNNCYYRVKGDFSIKDVGKSYTTLAAWQDATGQEQLDGAAVGVSVDPQLKAPGSGGAIGDASKLASLKAYDLLPGSPLIGKALDLNAQFHLAPSPHDFRGTPLPADAMPDLGAIQHQ
ncbi:MAG: right-handed parallel beta-helix repeat-containing protein [Verrucomicrobiae bacterium]